MSYEGWAQILCKVGHYRSCDCHENPIFEDDGSGYSVWRCDCGATAIWWNSVDETNGCYCAECDGSGCKWCDKGRIDGLVDLELLTEAVYEICSCCGHKKVVTERTYKIPIMVGHLL